MVEQCKFCKRFIEAKDFMREPIKSESGKSIIDKRRCIIAGGLVGPDDGCDQLILADIIWCRKNTQWLHREVCVKKYVTRREPECKKCNIGKELINLVRKVGTKKRKRKLLIRKKNGV